MRTLKITPTPIPILIPLDESGESPEEEPAKIGVLLVVDPGAVTREPPVPVESFVVVEPTKALNDSSAVKAALTLDPLRHPSGMVVLAPEMSFTAAHCEEL
jgi:hypothetical protein